MGYTIMRKPGNRGTSTEICEVNVLLQNFMHSTFFRICHSLQLLCYACPCHCSQARSRTVNNALISKRPLWVVIVKKTSSGTCCIFTQAWGERGGADFASVRGLITPTCPHDYAGRYRSSSTRHNSSWKRGAGSLRKPLHILCLLS